MGAAVVALAAIALAGCATAVSSGRGPAAGDIGALPRPSATGDVIAEGTVLQKGDGEPRLCLGAVAQSYPPQCTGPAIHGWDWASVEQAETASGVTWGSYAVQGTWDGTALTVTTAPIPLSLYDPMAHPDPRLEGEPGPSDEAKLLRVQRDLQKSGDSSVLGTWSANGYLFLSVIYDDGSVQDFVDARYGPDVVAVQSVLRPAG